MEQKEHKSRDEIIKIIVNLDSLCYMKNRKPRYKNFYFVREKKEH